MKRTKICFWGTFEEKQNNLSALFPPSFPSFPFLPLPFSSFFSLFVPLPPFSSLFLFFSSFRAAPLHFLGNFPFLPFPSLPFPLASVLPSSFLFPLFSPFPFVLVSFVCNIYYGVSFQFPPFFFIFPFFLKKSRFFFCCC